VNCSNHVISIVPRLPPNIDGVGDYALNLARQLYKNSSIQTKFIVGDPLWSGLSEIDGFPVSKIQERTTAALLDVLEEDCSIPILLHYVGYGYATRGCPSWLVQGINQRRTSYPKQRIVTMFHEVYGSGPPWTSTFWLLPLQKNLVSRLLAISDKVITSNDYYTDLLTQIDISKSNNIIAMPVFSSIGEPKVILPLSQRSKRLVVFGHRNGRSQVYEKCIVAVKTICEQLNIREIYDIGVPTGLNLHGIFPNLSVIENGITESEKISQVLQDSVVGFLNFPLPKYLAKSTIFSTYCAHGVLPCMVSSADVPIDGIASDQHYWSYDKNKNNQLTLELAQEIANNAHEHYEMHNLSTQGLVFANQLGLKINE
jgi:hypothetical protein